MTSSNIMDITSFISLPEPIIRFSKINLPKTSVLDRSLLNTEFINYWKVFRSNLLLKKKNINLLEPENIMEANNDQDKKQEEEKQRGIGQWREAHSLSSPACLACTHHEAKILKYLLMRI